jgi:hypothetical protein
MSAFAHKKSAKMREAREASVLKDCAAWNRGEVRAGDFDKIREQTNNRLKLESIHIVGYDVFTWRLVLIAQNRACE